MRLSCLADQQAPRIDLSLPFGAAGITRVCHHARQDLSTQVLGDQSLRASKANTSLTEVPQPVLHHL